MGQVVEKVDLLQDNALVYACTVVQDVLGLECSVVVEKFQFHLYQL